MKSVKILHCADIHIAAQDSFLGANADSRRFETLITFENIMDLAVSENVQIVAISGDLFDSENVPSAFFKPVINKIKAISPIKVVYCGGNHDPLNSGSPFMAENLPENLYVLPVNDTQITFDDIGTRVYGRSFENTHLQGEEEFSITDISPNYINIMVQHGELKSDIKSDYNAITPHFIKKSGMDYIALGHVHKCTPIGKIDNTHFAYCGCPEGQGFDELDQKGVYLGEISKGKADLKFISVSKRQHVYEKIDITDIDNISDYILNTLTDKYTYFADNLYKIELIGTIPENSEVNLAELTARLSNRLYFVKLKDSTEYKINYELLSKEASLKGVFVKNMLKKIKENPENEDFKTALKLGIKAFSGEVKYNED